MKKITLEIKRTNGEIEILDVTEKFPTMQKSVFDKIKTATAEAGKGEVIKAVITEPKNNIKELVKKYNNLHNEGAEGFVPDSEEFWTSLPDFKKWDETTEIK